MSKVKGILVVVLAAVFIVFIANCGGTGGATEFDSQTLNDNSTRIQSNVTSAELIFVGTITALGTAPTFWSGIARSTQGVTYTVDDVIKGTYTDSEITIYHMVVDGSRQAADTPGLSSDIFAVGNKLIVFATENTDYVLLEGYEVPRYLDVDEEYGTIPYSQQNEEVIVSMTDSAAMTLGVSEVEEYEIVKGVSVFKVLTVNGSQTDVESFNNLLNECKEQSTTLKDLVSMIQNSETFTVTINVVRDAENVFVDSFNGRQVDVKDLEDWHAGCDSKTERCQLFGHFLQEYWHASVTGDGYEPSHASALDMENKIRQDMGKTTTGGNHTGVWRSGDLYMFTPYNGTGELVKIVGGNKPAPGDVTTETIPPAAPTGLSADGSTPCQITITWTDNASNEDGYVIERQCPDTGEWVVIGPTDPNTTSWTNSYAEDPTLSQGVNYCYRVRAWRGVPAIYSAYSNEACATKQ